MKKIIFFSFLSFLCYLLPAQKELILKGAQADKKIAGAELIRIKPQTNVPAYIRFRLGDEINVQDLDLFMRKILLPSENDELRQIDEFRDELGYTHIRYRQYYGGYPVEGSMYTAQIKNGFVHAVHGVIFDKIGKNFPIQLSEATAFEYALSHVQAEVYKWELLAAEAPKGELLIAPLEGNYEQQDFRLAYKFDIYAHKPMSRTYTYIDAQTGALIWQLNRIHTADEEGTAETKYSGTQTIIAENTGSNFRLRETGRGNGIVTLNMEKGEDFANAVDFLDDDNFWDNVNENQDEVATDVHFGAEMTYDYFWETFNRNSIDGNGFQLSSYVHYGDGIINAFYDGERAAFGDGGGNTSPLTSVDIVGHEFAHGLTNFTASLIYQNESGALNESYSDIFGTTVERFARPDNWNWEIGEDIGRNFRSMSNPNSLNDPDTYQGDFWFEGVGNNGGVHTNSGVQNHWFYLLAEGGSGTNDLGNSFEVQGIGVDKAAAIAYRNLVVYLTPISDYQDAQFLANISAADLYGTCSPEVEATARAWYAVGLGAPYIPEVTSAFGGSPLQGCEAPIQIQFRNQSFNATSFSWDFGDGQTSNEVHPVHIYSDTGAYTVTLLADGGDCGTDSIISTDIVKVGEGQPCLLTAQASTQTACEGELMDSGGRNGNYGDETNYVVTIAVEGAYKIELEFLSFDYELDFDYLRIYDGPDTNSYLIGEYTGTELPEGGMISSSTGAITIQQLTDHFVTGAGFELLWKCGQITALPIAAFSTNDTLSCNGLVQFRDESVQATQWLWDFGDGNTSTQRNPQHAYRGSGPYTVALAVINELGTGLEIKTDFIVLDRPTAPEVADLVICATNEAILNANIDGEGQVNWHNAQGELIQTANTFTTEVNVGTTIFYAEREILGEAQTAGAVDTRLGGGGFHDNQSTQYLIFDVFEEIIIETVEVSSNANRTRNIQLWDRQGNLIETRTVDIPNGFSQVALNLTVPPGSGYRIGGTQMALFRNNSGPNYPYVTEDLMSVTGSSAGEDYYYYFYNWKVRGPSCRSIQVPVNVRRSERPAPEAAFEFSLENGTVMFTDLSTAALSWLWDFGDNDTSSAQNPLHTYSSNGDYVVQLIVFNSGGCVDTTTQIVSVSGITALEDELGGATIQLFPNPSRGQFSLWVELEEVADVQLRVFNNMGQIVVASPVQRGQQMRQQIDLRSRPAGTYFVQIRVNDRMAYRKYLKQ